jgi:hypothetical protein
MSIYNSKDTLYEYFNKYSAEKKDELDENKTNSPLIKTYCFETSSKVGTEEVLNELKQFYLIKKMEGNIFELNGSKQDKPDGWLEPLSSRFYLIYTTKRVNEVENQIKSVIKESPILDSLWLADTLFYNFFLWIYNNSPQYRFIRMKMEFDSNLQWNLANEVKKDAEFSELYDDINVNESQKKFEFTERISTVKELIDKLREIRVFSPARSISMLRFPGSINGGFDFFYDGKVTNRSSNFIDLRHNLDFVIKIYSNLVNQIEEKTWFNINEHNFKSSGNFIKGSPVIIEFDEPLDKLLFNNFIIRTFEKRYGDFRLWGEPIKLSEEKYHVYGLDLHLWQEIFMEFTPEIFVFVLPEGVCGNTVNRLITNIQHYLKPEFKVYVGEEPYNNLVERSLKEGLLL